MTDIVKAEPRPVRRDEPHWYRIHISECVLCGKDDSWRERVAGPPPQDPGDRYIREPDWACDSHFL